MYFCKAIGCSNEVARTQDFCEECTEEMAAINKVDQGIKTGSMSEQYPAYYKSVGDMTEIDVYAVHHLFNIYDPAGCIQHASKKLLLSGVRTGGKSVYKDIKEARDTLTRWLQLNHHNQ
jgi:hypothetical protein